MAAGGVPAFPVFLSDGGALTGKDGNAWTEAIRKSFAEEFGPQTGGTTLLFVGGPGFDATKSTGLIAAGVPLTIAHLQPEHATQSLGKKLLLVRPDQHVAWRADAAPEHWQSVFACITGQVPHAED